MQHARAHRAYMCLYWGSGYRAPRWLGPGRGTGTSARRGTGTLAPPGIPPSADRSTMTCNCAQCTTSPDIYTRLLTKRCIQRGVHTKERASVQVHRRALCMHTHVEYLQEGGLDAHKVQEASQHVSRWDAQAYRLQYLCF